MIKLEHLKKSFGATIVLEDVSFILGDKQRAALVGYNGTGKSTILKILAGLEPADSGLVEISPGARIGYLPQDTSVIGQESISDYVRGITGISALEIEMQDALDHIDQPGAQARYDKALDLFENLNGYEFEYRLETMLRGFGLEHISPARSVTQLSSGQKSKVALIALLMQDNDVLLLDEPTNNLDLSALIWLEDFLRKSSATVLVVSHDRRFVDRIATKIIELDWHTRTANIMNGTYTDYLAEMARRRERQRQEYAAQQEEIERLSGRADSIKRRAAAGAKMSDSDKFRQGFMRDKASKSAQGAKAIEKRIEQMDLVEKPFERDPLRIEVSKNVREGSAEIDLMGVQAGYPGQFTVGPVSLHIPFGTRLGILGMNGVGKSTLLKVITGHTAPLTGSVQIGSGVNMGDMLQEHDTLPRQLSPIEYMQERVGIERSEAYGLLARFGIPAPQAKEPIGALSPGGRARMLIALFSALGKNVLVLDEPTNHLDLEAMDALEEALGSFEGTLIVVSHDRHFISQANLDTLLEVVDGRLEKIDDWDAYLRAAEERAQRLIRSL